MATCNPTGSLTVIINESIELPNGKTAFEKSINNEPEKYFTKEVMEQLEVAVAKEFKYGNIEEESGDVGEGTE